MATRAKSDYSSPVEPAIARIDRLPHLGAHRVREHIVGHAIGESFGLRLLGDRERDMERDLTQFRRAAAANWRPGRAWPATTRRSCARRQETFHRKCGAPRRRSRRDRCRDRHRRCWSDRRGRVLPLRLIGGNGLPVPMTARPSVQAIKILRRRLAALGRIGQEKDHRPAHVFRHARTMASEKAPGWPDVPISTVGCALATTSASPIRPGDASFQSRRHGRGFARTALETAAARPCLRPAGLRGRRDRSGCGPPLRSSPHRPWRAATSAQMPVPAEPAPSTAMRCWSAARP